jgi:hypothetical protein
MRTKSIILFILLICASSCERKSTVEYKIEITGTFATKENTSFGSNIIVLIDSQKNNHNWNDVESGWSYSWQETVINNGYNSISITVSNVSNVGDITVNLYRNDKLVETKTGYGGAPVYFSGMY